MISSFFQYFLYFCPECQEETKRKFTAFDFPINKDTKICCQSEDCNAEIIRIKALKDKYKIVMNCPICGQTHNFVITSKTMWEKDFFILNCPQSGFGILFVGKNEDDIEKAFRSQNDIIAGLVSQDEEDEIDLFFDIFDRMVEMSKQKAIICSCGCEEILINVSNDGKLIMKCKHCKKSIEFEVCEELLEKLLSCDKFEI